MPLNLCHRLLRLRPLDQRREPPYPHTHPQTGSDTRFRRLLPPDSTPRQPCLEPTAAEQPSRANASVPTVDRCAMDSLRIRDESHR